MTDIEEATQPVDGRVARRKRNVDAVLDVVLEMFEEEQLFPTIEQASKRSGLSLRSLYRYFADQSALVEAVIVRNRERSAEIWHIHAIGQGPLDDRIREFAAMRLRLHEREGASYRASVANAARHPRVRDELARTRDVLRTQCERQFQPELEARKPADRLAAAAACDTLTTFDAIDYLRRHRRLSVAETELTLRTGLSALLS